MHLFGVSFIAVLGGTELDLGKGARAVIIGVPEGAYAERAQKFARAVIADIRKRDAVLAVVVLHEDLEHPLPVAESEGVVITVRRQDAVRKDDAVRIGIAALIAVVRNRFDKPARSLRAPLGECRLYLFDGGITALCLRLTVVDDPVTAIHPAAPLIGNGLVVVVEGKIHAVDLRILRERCVIGKELGIVGHVVFDVLREIHCRTVAVIVQKPDGVGVEGKVHHVGIGPGADELVEVLELLAEHGSRKFEVDVESLLQILDERVLAVVVVDRTVDRGRHPDREGIGIARVVAAREHTDAAHGHHRRQCGSAKSFPLLHVCFLP